MGQFWTPITPGSGAFLHANQQFYGGSALVCQTGVVSLSVLVGHPPQLAGSSAIIGFFMGFLAASKETRIIESSPPLLSPLAPIVGFSLKIEIQILLLIGLYFLCGTGGVINLQTRPGHLDLLYPAFGLCCGYLGGLISPRKASVLPGEPSHRQFEDV